MDPNENVRQQNRLLARIHDLASDGADYSAAREELADLQSALAEWLACGGFAPTERLIIECCCDTAPGECWLHGQDDSGDCYHSDAAW